MRGRPPTTILERMARLPRLAEKETADPEARVHLQLACFDWYLVAGDEAPNGDWHCYGLMCGLREHLGYFTLSEILETRSPEGDRPMVEVGFRPTRLSKIRKEVDIDPPSG